MSKYDVAVIGAGHNGLTAAAYLARAGKKVLVLDRQQAPGGTTATDEFADGFRAPALFADAGRLHPSIATDLDLRSQGLRLVRAASGPVLLRDGGPPIRFGADGSVTGIDAADADALRALETFLGRVAGALESALCEPLPEIERTGLGDVLELVNLGWKLRKLGRREMPAAMRMLPMSMRDVVDEHVQDGRLKAGIAWRGLIASTQGPYAPAGMISALYHRPTWGGGLFAPPVFVVGGPGALAEALSAAARKAGAEIRTGTEVKRIRVKEDAVAGITLASGEEIDVERVLSALDPRTTMLRLLEPGWLDTDLIFAAQNVRGHGTVSVVRMALDGLPVFTDVPAEALAGRLEISPSLLAQEKAADHVKYGRVPTSPVMEVTLPTLTDPSLAPTDAHVLHAWVQYTPYRLRDTDWEREREGLGRSVLATLEAHAPGISGRVKAIDVVTPADIERRHGIAEGHPYHVELTLDQFLYMRPFPGRYHNRMPVAGLYLGGPGCHPGGGITGLPGKIAARQVLQDWKRARVA